MVLVVGTEAEVNGWHINGGNMLVHFTDISAPLGTEKCDAGAANYIVAGNFEDYDTSKMYVMKYADVVSL
ncbi:hypothetical protein Pelo_3504 [Pelomyxa schiedti]|nr:hypothetical protein Pelo_3504 [Pelomyxa schiedti]